MFSTPVYILLYSTFATLKVYVFLFLSSISLTTSESFPLPLHEITNSFNGKYFTLLTQSEWTWPRVWHVTKREWLDKSYGKKDHHLENTLYSKNSTSNKTWSEHKRTSLYHQNYWIKKRTTVYMLQAVLFISGWLVQRIRGAVSWLIKNHQGHARYTCSKNRANGVTFKVHRAKNFESHLQTQNCS